MPDETKPIDESAPPATTMKDRIGRALRGEVDARTVALEGIRRTRVALRQRRERRELDQLNDRPARLAREFANRSPAALLKHFRSRTSPKFFPGFSEIFSTPSPRFRIQTDATPEAMAPIEWNRDPKSGVLWPLDYHLDLKLQRQDGSDARALWEANRLGQLVRKGCEYAATRNEKLAEDFFAQLDDWRAQNPVARGPNWACAMEVALRATNLLAAFEAFRHSSVLDEKRLTTLLAAFDQHAEHIRRNSEFSYIATSNHYLSDVVGLLWLGIMLPELRGARAWRKFGLRELLRELDKQVLPDGADFESSTGYHRLVLELFLFSFLLCRENGIEIAPRYWTKLRAMAGYLRAYLRPDGRAPLIGDTDSGQILPIVVRAGDDHGYLADLSAAIFNEPAFKTGADQAPPDEMFWLLGSDGERTFAELDAPPAPASQAFPAAGIYVLRHLDNYLLLNASDSGVNGRGSHGHNDKLSIEVSACGVPFLVDPGTYIYSADWHERHLFRSTAYHSTVTVDGEEQNTITESLPFVIGNEARPQVLAYEFAVGQDRVLAQHAGYERLPEPVTHAREVIFNKVEKFWLVTDTFNGVGDHRLDFYFHFAPRLEVEVADPYLVRARHPESGVVLVLAAVNYFEFPHLEPRFSSRDYGHKEPSVAARWTIEPDLPVSAQWVIVPLCPCEDEVARLSIIERLQQEAATT